MILGVLVVGVLLGVLFGFSVVLFGVLEGLGLVFFFLFLLGRCGYGVWLIFLAGGILWRRCGIWFATFFYIRV